MLAVCAHRSLPIARRCCRAGALTRCSAPLLPSLPPSSTPTSSAQWATSVSVAAQNGNPQCIAHPRLRHCRKVLRERPQEVMQ
jgi:hypothetical protein